MEDSDTFLRDEVGKYHDVRPINNKLLTDVGEEVVISEVNKNESPKKSKRKAHERSKFFDVSIEKDSGEKELESKPVKAPRQLIFVEGTQKNKEECDTFLRDEIERYHDVRPIIGKSPTEIKERVVIADVKKDESSKKSKKSTFFNVFKKKGSEEREIKLKPVEVSAEPSTGELFKKNMEDSDTFLRDEIEKYHDVHPIIKKSPTSIESEFVISEMKEIETSKKLGNNEAVERKSTSSDVFLKKGTEVKEVELEASVIPAFSESNEKNKEDCNTFLKDEIEEYHDVRPILEVQPILIKEIMTSSEIGTNVNESTGSHKKGRKKERKGLFGLFKKKESVDSSKITISIPESVMKDMKDSETFLKGEVEIYHDVRPIVGKALEEKVPVEVELQLSPEKNISRDSENTGDSSKTPVESRKEKSSPFLSLFSRKNKSSRKIEEEGKKSILPLSPEIVQDITNSSEFLEFEINKYHDVRPLSEKLPIEEEIFEPILLSPMDITEDVLKTMNETNKFIHSETDGFPDAVLQDLKTKQSSTENIFQETDSEQPKRTVTTTVTKEPLPRGERVTQVTTEVISGTIQLGPEALSDLTRLEEEINAKLNQIREETTTHDESPEETPQRGTDHVEEEIYKEDSLQKTVTKSQATIPPVSVGISKQTFQPVEIEKSKEGKKGFLGLFGKKAPKDQESSQKLEISEGKIIPPNAVKETLNENDSFLNNEIDNYHDVRPYIGDASNTKTVEEPAEVKIKILKSVSPEMAESESKKGILGKQSDEDVFYHAQSAFINETVKVTQQSPKVAGGSQTSPKVGKTDVSPIIRERITITERHFVKEGGYLDETYVVVNAEDIDGHVTVTEADSNKLHETANFLNGELDKYEDGKYKAKKEKAKEVQPKLSAETLGNMISTKTEPEIKTKEKGGKLFGMFSKKKSQDKDTEPVGKDQKKDKKKPKKDKEAKEATLEKPGSKDFSKGEDDRCQDGKKTKDESKEEGGSFFGLFAKKTKPHGKENDINKEPVHSLSREIVENMENSNEFLQNEVKGYHDVRPILEKFQEPAEISEKKETSPPVEKPLSAIDPILKELDESPKRTITTTVTKQAIPSGERVTKVTTEVVSGMIQLDPSVLSDISKLEEEINAKLDQIRTEVGDSNVPEDIRKTKREKSESPSIKRKTEKQKGETSPADPEHMSFIGRVGERISGFSGNKKGTFKVSQEGPEEVEETLRGIEGTYTERVPNSEIGILQETVDRTQKGIIAEVGKNVDDMTAKTGEMSESVQMRTENILNSAKATAVGATRETSGFFEKVEDKIDSYSKDVKVKSVENESKKTEPKEKKSKKSEGFFSKFGGKFKGGEKSTTLEKTK
ncbi:hypothetical protein JTB14_038263 [Gonioctena quinquepunctata]|nr:hypothetical protein JTB14_038263 [Gonioctena quinquepunctata]